MLTEMTKEEFNIQLGVNFEYVKGSTFYSCGKFFIHFFEMPDWTPFDMKYGATIWGHGEHGPVKVASMESDQAGRLLMAADKFCGVATEKNSQWRTVACIGWGIASASILAWVCFALS